MRDYVQVEGFQVFGVVFLDQISGVFIYRTGKAGIVKVMVGEKAEYSVIVPEELRAFENYTMATSEGASILFSDVLKRAANSILHKDIEQ